jgi:hypothetical protein
VRQPQLAAGGVAEFREMAVLEITTLKSAKRTPSLEALGVIEIDPRTINGIAATSRTFHASGPSRWSGRLRSDAVLRFRKPATPRLGLSFTHQVRRTK